MMVVGFLLWFIILNCEWLRSSETYYYYLQAESTRTQAKRRRQLIKSSCGYREYIYIYDSRLATAHEMGSLKLTSTSFYCCFSLNHMEQAIVLQFNQERAMVWDRTRALKVQ